MIFNNLTIWVRQIAELERHKSLVPHQCGAQAGAKSQKKHSPAMVTAKRLHRCVVDYSYGYPERPCKIEADPAFAQMFWVPYDSAVAHRRGQTNRRDIKVPTAHVLLESVDELGRPHSRTRNEFALDAPRHKQFHVRAADIDDQNFSLHE